MNEEYYKNGKKIDSLPDMGKEGVYETIRTYSKNEARHLFHLNDHLTRLDQSALTLGFTPWRSTNDIRKELETIVSQSHLLGNLKVKLIVTRTEVYYILTTITPNELIYTQGVSVVTVEGVRETPQAKSLDNTVCTQAFTQAQKNNCHDALLINPQTHNITEGSRSNIFIIKDGELITPGTGMLRGVTRKIVLDLARKQELTVKMQPLSQQSLLEADEVFLTQTSRGIVPVTGVDNKPVSNGTVGPLTTQLITSYSNFITAWISGI
jgi:branched-subunit amino acid aminotransferase/4-amino-4-deoxychorismate lyase